MRRVAELLYSPRGFSIPKFPANRTKISSAMRWVSTQSSSSKAFSVLYEQFADKFAYSDVRAKEELTEKVSLLKDKLMKNVNDEYSFENLLEVEGWNLINLYSNEAASVELLGLLESSPHLAIKVFNWRRKKDQMKPMSSQEYAKGIKIAGKIKDVDLADEIFKEASNKQIKNTSMYNALMSAYMRNGLSEKCLSIYQDLKQDINCCPTLVTFNTLISIFGHIVLIDKMEAAFHEMKHYNIAPSITTYNNMIAGYITAWMWDSMENTYRMIETGHIRPNLGTHLLMLRGYAHSGNIEKMEEIYNIVGPHVPGQDITLVRAMICAYCKYPYTNRVKRIKELLRLIPEDEYKPWLNVLLIRLYAEEDLVDQMDESIEEAFKHNTCVNTVKIMCSISSTYARNKAVDKLATFVTRSRDSGWRICRDLYHDLMLAFALNKRIEEMEQVLVEMERFNYECSKRTFEILYMAYYIAYMEHDERYRPKFYRVLGLICKLGYSSIAGKQVFSHDFI